MVDDKRFFLEKKKGEIGGVGTLHYFESAEIQLLLFRDNGLEKSFVCFL